MNTGDTMTLRESVVPTKPVETIISENIMTVRKRHLILG
ncbi:MAG: hypothetical protein J07HQW2_02348 [Haloquadratum walsbyi J07HQW2]|uniref:Uncharacterized protein n=1 Tax=Haloquadratum walsbyi J07HQW2 TaxID=1238425 RepID=U1NGF4_9EURY|nr:MAG: hypothetical protein J07HQW2_02348 [Haloquadratum walsbyi J07HQW2]